MSPPPFEPAALPAAVAGAALSGLSFCLKIGAFLVPALVLYDVLAPLPLFARWGRRLTPWIARLGMSPACIVPLAAGFFLGIAYGAGIIIPFADQRRLTPREIACVGVFLVTCHAVVEDTLLFALAGTTTLPDITSRLVILVLTRLTLAVAVTMTFAKLTSKAE